MELGIGWGEISEVVEFCEAAAYADVYKWLPKDFTETYGARCISIGSATALVMEEPAMRSDEIHRAIGLGVEQLATEEQVEEILQLYRPLGKPFCIQVSPFAQPQELVEWLRVRGILPLTGIHKLLRRCGSVPQVVLSSGLQVSDVSLSDKDIYADIIIKGSPAPMVWKAYYAATVGRPNWRHYLVSDQGRYIAAGAMFTNERAAHLFTSATLIPYRRRGAQQALIVRCLHDALAAGCQWVVAETGDETSLNNLGRMGFLLVYVRLGYHPL